MKIVFYNADGTTFATYTIGTSDVTHIEPSPYGTSVTIKYSSKPDQSLTIGNMSYKITRS